MSRATDLHSFDQPPAAYRHLLEDMPVMLWTANPQGVWEYVNRAWVTYTGLLGETSGCVRRPGERAAVQGGVAA